MDPIENFANQVQDNLGKLSQDGELHERSLKWMAHAGHHNYVYNFRWMGVPIIQFPQDIIAVQEIIWKVKPDLIVETGIAHGGSLILSASILQLLGEGEVIGIDVDIRAHNRQAIEAHSMSSRIRMIEGSSIDPKVIGQVAECAEKAKRVVVILDSHHSHEHVLAELNAYSSFVKKDSYIIAMDTGIEEAPAEQFSNREWGPGDNPRTAVWEFIKANDRFEIDQDYNAKLQITSSIDGYLRCIKD